MLGAGAGRRPWASLTFIQGSCDAAIRERAARSVIEGRPRVDAVAGIEARAQRRPDDTSIFRSDEPTFDEILSVRAERQAMVTEFLDAATPALLAETRANPWGGDDWRPSVGDCVRVILEEEWAHLRYVRRDLALLA